MRAGNIAEKELYTLLIQGQEIIKKEVERAFSEVGARIPELAQGFLKGSEIRSEEVFSLVDFQRLHHRITTSLNQLNLPINNHQWLRFDEVIPKSNFDLEGIAKSAQEYRNTLILEGFLNDWMDKAWIKAVQSIIPGIPKILVKKINPGERVRTALVKNNLDHCERCRIELIRCLNGFLTNLRIKMKNEMLYRFEGIIFEIYDEMTYFQNNLQKVAVI